MTTVGYHGGGVRSDAKVSVSDSSKTSYELRSSVEMVYGRSIRSQIERTLSEFGDPPIHVEVLDSGALPFALQARIEAAICQHLGLPLPAICRVKFHAPRDRSRRTRLYLPGDEPKLFPNAPLYGSDILVLDLEDSVAESSKFAAKAIVRRALVALDWGQCERVVRIGKVEDLELAPLGVQTLLVPKAEDASVIREISHLLDALDVPTLILPLIESAKGLVEAFAVASASNRVIAITIGLEDYVKDLGAERSEAGDESLYALGHLVNAARAAGVTPLASVYPHADDPEATYRYAKKMRTLGYEGIGCIHPRQVAPAHRAFAPTETEVDSAKAIVDAYEASGKGVVAVEGRMVDLPVYERAKKTLGRSHQ